MHYHRQKYKNNKHINKQAVIEIFVYFNSTTLKFIKKSVKAKILGTYMTTKLVTDHNQNSHE